MHVILLRGVNVSGANRLPMAEFRELLADLGFANPRSYIQSGNAIVGSDLAADQVEARVQQGILQRFGFAPEVFALPPEALARALSDHPFAGAAPEHVHVVFLRQTPASLDEGALRALAAPGDGWALAPGRFTLHTPGGIGRSRIADRLGRLLPGAQTARNLKTVAALVAMTQA